MKKIVTLWLANFKNHSAFDKYVSGSYSPDGNALPSPFMNEIGVEYIDSDYFEGVFDKKFSKLNTISGLLKDFSYDEKIIPAIVATLGSDTLEKSFNTVLLYYKKLEQTGEKNVNPNVQYFCTVSY